MQMERIRIKNAREGINTVDAQRVKCGMTQMRISEVAGANDTGQTYGRMWRSGDCRLSTFLRFARAAGYDIILAKKEEQDEKPGK